tara:strand:- start:619 stop:726 length:108 start_codon:yes stop_codon:yes gene_type:complete
MEEVIIIRIPKEDIAKFWVIEKSKKNKIKKVVKKK